MNTELLSISRINKARKEHDCDFCNSVIKIKESYIKETVKHEGDFIDICIHNHCNNIINTFLSKNGASEYTSDEVEDWLRDKHCYDCRNNEDCLIGKPQRCNLIIKLYEEI